jgi:NADPH:quinone reductase-like Zn-dependent oxidoreductase
VFPFILRGVRLIGIDSVEASVDKKTQAWKKIANEFKIDTLDKLVNEISLDEIQQSYKDILEAKAVGRYLVKL